MDNAQFISFSSSHDLNRVPAGTPFLKQWLVRNTGQRKWNQAYRLVFVGGDTALTGVFSHTVPEANPGDEVVISVEMVSPPPRDEPYVGNWRLHEPADYAIVRGRFESVKVLSGITVAELKAYEAKFYLCRLFESFNGRHVPVSDFVRAVIPDITSLVEAGVEYFEFHNEPNLTHEGLNAHGVTGSWSNGAEFAQYIIEGRNRLKQQFPNIKVGFPGLSPGPSTEYQFGHDRGFRLKDTTFLEGAVSAIKAADFIGIHAYYLNMEELKTQAIDMVKSYRRRWPDKLLFVTEFSNPDPGGNVSAVEKGRQARAFYELCSQIPGVGAAYYFIVSGTGWDRQALRRELDGQPTGILEGIFT